MKPEYTIKMKLPPAVQNKAKQHFKKGIDDLETLMDTKPTEEVMLEMQRALNRMGWAQMESTEFELKVNRNDYATCCVVSAELHRNMAKVGLMAIAYDMAKELTA